MQRFAVFDIDGTVFRLSMLFHLVHTIITRGEIPPETRAKLLDNERRWRARQMSYEDYIVPLVEALDAWLAEGHEVQRFQSVIEEALPPRHNEVHTFTSTLLRLIQQMNYATIAITWSPHLAADVFCKHWGFTHVRGSFSEVTPAGRFTGARPVPNKPEVLKEFLDEHGYLREGSIGVGDTEGDLSMIRETEHPVAFNPSGRMVKGVRTLPSCLVVQERKNVCTVIGFENGQQVPLDFLWRSRKGTSFLPPEVVLPLISELNASDYELLVL